MATGLLALLDDVAALVKVSAASLDDIPAQVAKTTGKVSGIVIDDAAVTPKYVVGLDPSRELAIIGHIAKKSLINKVILLSPVALVLGYFAPWLIQPILMLGGGYLCYEGYEKIHSLFIADNSKNINVDELKKITPEELEKERTAGAIRTDFILSAEITAITFSTVADKDFITQVAVLFCVGIFITLAVYGFVALIVKADDFGLYLANTSKKEAVKKIGTSIVAIMPGFLKWLSYVGTAAMLWVGADIIAHGIKPLHHLVVAVGEFVSFNSFAAWMAKASTLALAGIIMGFIIAQFIHRLVVPVISKIKK